MEYWYAVYHGLLNHLLTPYVMVVQKAAIASVPHHYWNGEEIRVVSLYSMYMSVLMQCWDTLLWMC